MPWFTGSGDAVFVILTSACVGLATDTETVAVLFAELGSPTVLDTLGEFIMIVPGAVVRFTFITIGKFTDVPFVMV